MRKNVDLVFDIFDQAAMLYYDNLKIDYLDALSEINNNLNHDQYNTKLSDEVIKKLRFIYKPIFESNFLNEEYRLALELYIVKGLKHANYSQNLMTPDFINYLFVHTINFLFEENDIVVMDTSLGTGNLLAAIKNNYKGSASLIGLEHDRVLTSFASSFMEIQHSDIKIYFQNALNKVFDKVDLIVGDLDSYDVEDGLGLYDDLYLKNVRYFPYLVISSRLDNILENGYFIYLVDNDFFSKKDKDLFIEDITKKASILGAIILPDEIFRSNHIGKIMIIGKKKVSPIKEINVVNIKNTEVRELEAAIEKIKIMIDNIKEE